VATGSKVLLPKKKMVPVFADLPPVRHVEVAAMSNMEVGHVCGSFLVRTRMGILASEFRDVRHKMDTVVAFLVDRHKVSACTPPHRHTAATVLSIDVVLIPLQPDGTPQEECCHAPPDLLVVSHVSLHAWEVAIATSPTPVRALCLRKHTVSSALVEAALTSRTHDLLLCDEGALRRLDEDPRFRTKCFERLLVDEAGSMSPRIKELPRSEFVWLIEHDPLIVPAWPALRKRLCRMTPEMRRLLHVRAAWSENRQAEAATASTATNVQHTTLRVTRWRWASSAEGGGGGEEEGEDDARERPPSDAAFACLCAVSALEADERGAARAVRSLGISESHVVHHEDALCSLVARVASGTDPGAATRVRSDVCPISLDRIRDRAVTPCCFVAFELVNLLRATAVSGTCPTCRKPLVPTEIFVQLCLAERSKGDLVRWAVEWMPPQARMLVLTDSSMDASGFGVGHVARVVVARAGALDALVGDVANEATMLLTTTPVLRDAFERLLSRTKSVTEAVHLRYQDEPVFRGEQA
jgi:hypothetical protein